MTSKVEAPSTTLPVFVCEKCGLKAGALGFALCPKCRIQMIQSEDEEMVISRLGEPGVIRKKE